MAKYSVARKLRVMNDFIDDRDAPIPVIALAHALGIRVYKTNWPDSVSGKIQRDSKRGGESGFAIFYNQSHHENRRRFTIAHEVAHYILHEDSIGDGLFDDALYRSGLSSRSETQANALAADILMPWSHLNDYIQKYGSDVSRLAEEFKVSKHAMAIRLGVTHDGDF